METIRVRTFDPRDVEKLKAFSRVNKGVEFREQSGLHGVIVRLILPTDLVPCIISCGLSDGAKITHVDAQA